MQVHDPLANILMSSDAHPQDLIANHEEECLSSATVYREQVCAELLALNTHSDIPCTISLDLTDHSVAHAHVHRIAAHSLRKETTEELNTKCRPGLFMKHGNDDAYTFEGLQSS